MTKRSRNTQQQNSPPSQLPVPTLLAVVACVAYWVLFLQQPSMYGLQTSSGEQIPRVLDLYWMWSNGPSLLLEGASPVAAIDRLPIVLAAIIWLTAGWWIGKPFAQYARFPISRLEAGALSTLLGLALLSTLTFFFGVAGLIGSRWPLGITVVVLAIASTVVQRIHREPIEPPERKQTPRGQMVFTAWASRLIPLLGSSLALFYVLSSVLPAWEFDVLEYHLQAPKEFVQAGRIGFIEHNIYANMPLSTEMHALAAMVLIGGEDAWWWGGMVGKLVTGSYTLLAAALILGFTSRHFGALIGWASASLLLATPASLHVSSCGLVDMALGAYLLAAVWAALLLHSSRAEEPATLTCRAIVVFVLAGGAAACKYTGLVCCLIPVTIVVCISSRGLAAKSQSIQPIIKIVSGGLLALCLTVIPWYAKNAVLIGNPVYPLASSVFGLHDDDANDRWAAAHRPGGPTADAPFSPSELISAAKQIAYSSRFLNPGLYFLAVCGVVLTLLRPGSISVEARQNVFVWMSVSVWIVVTWWLFTHRIDRFWFPMLPLLSLLAAVGMSRLVQLANVGTVVAMALAGIVWGAMVGLSGGGPNDVRIFTPMQQFRANLTAPGPNAIISPTISWCNAKFQDHDGQRAAKLLLIGQAAAFQFQVPIEYSTCFDTSLAEKLLRDKSQRDQRDGLNSHGITHIAIDWLEIDRYRKPGNYGYSDWPTTQTPQEWIDSGLVQRVSTPFEREAFDVFEVLPSASPE